MNELSMTVGGGYHLAQLDPEPSAARSALAWQDEALCAQVDTEMFYPDKGGATKEAKAVCKACPVRSECLEYALARDERFGIWGGVSERDRRRMKAARRAA